MNNNEMKITTADPSAIGIFGLAIVTLVASSQKMGWTAGVGYAIPWAIFLGALAQIFAGIFDSKRNNLFGTTVFLGYGLFWLGVAMSWMINLGVFGETIATNLDVKQLGFAFLGYFIFSVVATIASLSTNKALFLIFIFIDTLFLGLSLSTIWGINAGHSLAAYSEFLVSIIGFYIFAADFLNGHYGKIILPVGKPFNVFTK